MNRPPFKLPAMLAVVTLSMLHALFPQDAPAQTFEIVPVDDSRVEVTLSGPGTGSVTVNGVGCYDRPGCTIVVSSGRPLTVEAVAVAGSRFSMWSSGPCLGQGSVCTFTAPQGASAAPAVFELNDAIGQGMRFVPSATCRIVDTRLASQFGGRLNASETRVFQLALGPCPFPANVSAVSINVTVVPAEPIPFISVYPAGAARPNVSTLNSLDGRIKSNAAIVPTTGNGAIAIYTSGATDVIIDVNGFFGSGILNSYTFYTLQPCRVMDTRGPAGTFGGPFLGRLQTRVVPVPASSCGVPSDAKAYSLNITAVPRAPLPFLTVWETGQPLPLPSTLNSLNGGIVANAAIVPAGLNGSVSFYATGDTDLVVDINGYFGTTGQTSPLDFYPLLPCRISDTRNPTGTFGGPIYQRVETRDVPIPASACNVPQNARAYALNSTVVPAESLAILILWPAGLPIPTISTLNALDASITSNAAIVPAGTNGSINAYSTNITHLILDISGYFAVRPAQ